MQIFLTSFNLYTDKTLYKYDQIKMFVFYLIFTGTILLYLILIVFKFLQLIFINHIILSAKS